MIYVIFNTFYRVVNLRVLGFCYNGVSRRGKEEKTLKLSRLLKCLREYNPIWLTQRQIISTDVSKGKLSVVVSEE